MTFQANSADNAKILGNHELMISPRAEKTLSRYDTPYLGLKTYSEEDADRFFGRDQDQRIISANLKASRLTLLYGASGVGKSSVLRAGVIFHLNNSSRTNLALTGSPRFVAVYCNSWRDDPVLHLSMRIEQAIKPYLKEQQKKAAALSGNLVEQLRSCTERANATLLIILDQFEEYFLYHPESGGEDTFDGEFPRAVNSYNLRANFLVSIRDDALSRLDRLKNKIPNILGNYLRIDHLDREGARDAIEQPLNWYNKHHQGNSPPVTIEPTLVKEVLEQVKTGELRLSSSGLGTLRRAATQEANDVRIEAAYLQLVMTRLWAEDKDSSQLRLRTLQTLGGAKQIVATHLHRVMGDLTPEEQQMAANIFLYLVTPSGERIAETLFDLSELTNFPKNKLGVLFERLSSSEIRILRPVESAPGQLEDTHYQIFHAVLAPAVLEWRARYIAEQERLEAKKRTEQELAEAEERTEIERQRAERKAKTARKFRLLSISLAAVALLAGGLFAGLWKWREVASERQAKVEELALTAAARGDFQQDPELRVSLALHLVSIIQDSGRPVPNELIDILGQAVQASRTRVTVDLTARRQVLDVAMTDDGRRFVTATDNGEVSLWNAFTGEKLLSFPKQEGQRITALALSRDARYVAAVSSDGSAMVWEAAKRSESFSVTAQQGKISSVAFSPNGQWLAVASGHTVEIQDIASRKALQTFHDRGIVEFVIFSRDGNHLATASDDNTAKVWDSSNGRNPMVLGGHKNGVLSVAFSPDGRRIATGGLDGEAKIWDTSSGKLLLNLSGHTDTIFRVAFDPSQGSRLATASADGTARVWDTSSGHLLFSLEGHFGPVTGIEFSPDGLRAVTGSKDGTARVWDTSSFHVGPVQSVTFNQDDSLLATGSNDGTTRIWQPLWDKITLKQVVPPLKQPAGVAQVCFSPDGKLLASANWDGQVRVWDTSAWKTLRKLPGSSANAATGPDEASTPTGVNTVAFSPNGRVLAAAGDDEQIKLWDTTSWISSASIPAKNGRINFLTFSPDGDSLAVAGRTVVVWKSIMSQKSVPAYREPEGDYRLPVWGVAYSPNGRFLATVSLDGTARVVDIQGSRESRWLRDGGREARSIVFDSKGDRIAVASWDRTVEVWDWDGVEAHELARFTHPTGVSAVALRRDGKYLATGADDGMIRLWPLDLDDLKKLALSRITRQFRSEECRKYFHSDRCP